MSVSYVKREWDLKSEADEIGGLHPRLRTSWRLTTEADCRHHLCSDPEDRRRDAAGPEGATDAGGAAAVRAAAVLRRALHGLQRDLQVIRHLQNGKGADNEWRDIQSAIYEFLLMTF